MHDGHNLFLKEEAFAGNTWRTDDVINMLDKMNAIEEVIVVGIHPHDRMNEYTMPGYEDYGRFLVEKLKPLIDGKHRTLNGPTNTAAMESSLGGVVSFYIGWQEVFGKIACLSSTFTYRDNLLDRVSTESKRKLRIYLDSGWPGDNYEPTGSMRDRLIWKGYRPDSERLYLLFPRLSTTRMRGLRVARFHSNSFSETFHGSQNRHDPGSGCLSCCSIICRPDSKGAYENILSSCLEVRVVC